MMERKTLMTLAVPKDYDRNQRTMRSQVLLEAAMLGQGDRIRNACKEGVDTEIRSSEGKTPLLKAVTFGHWDAAAALLEAKADLTAKDSRGFTALKIATENHDEPMLRILREHGAKE